MRISFLRYNRHHCGLIGYKRCGQDDAAQDHKRIIQTGQRYGECGWKRRIREYGNQKAVFHAYGGALFSASGHAFRYAFILLWYYPKWRDKTFFSLAEAFGLDTKRRIAGFSKGMQRQAGIILAFSVSASYFMLDEVFDGLDLSMRRMMKKLLDAYVKKTGATVIITSHNLRELEDNVDQIGMIKDRKLFFDGTVGQLHDRYRTYSFSPPPAGTAVLEGTPAFQHIRVEDGRCRCMAEGNEKEVLKKLSAAGCTDISVFPVTLEEFFLNEGSRRIDDFDDIF